MCLLRLVLSLALYSHWSPHCLMYWLYMITNMCFPSSLIVTLATLIPNSLIYWLHMSMDITLIRSFVLTLITFVLLHILTLCGCWGVRHGTIYYFGMFVVQQFISICSIYYHSHYNLCIFALRVLVYLYLGYLPKFIEVLYVGHFIILYYHLNMTKFLTVVLLKLNNNYQVAAYYT